MFRDTVFVFFPSIDDLQNLANAFTLLPVSELMMKITAPSSFFVQKTMKHGRERSSISPMPPLYYLFPSSISTQGSIFEELCHRGVSIAVIENMLVSRNCFSPQFLHIFIVVRSVSECNEHSHHHQWTPHPSASWEYAACDLQAPARNGNF